MKCPKCWDMDSKVIDSRMVDNGRGIRRRRECEYCQYRFTTFEKIGITYLFILKKDGSKQIYDKDKLANSITLAFAKRNINTEKIDEIISELELKWSGLKELKSAKLGEDVLKVLKKHDIVAYIRFASVYKQFDSLEDFENIVK